MQGVHEQSFFGLYLDPRGLNRITRLLVNIKTLLLYLVSPEDTTREPVERRVWSAKHDGMTVLAGLKVLFWLVAAIFLTLLIGQLK